MDTVEKEPGVQLPPGGQFCSRIQVWGRGELCGTRWERAPHEGDSRGRNRLPPGDLRGGGAGGRGRAADTAASAAAAAPGFHWPPALP